MFLFFWGVLLLLVALVAKAAFWPSGAAIKASEDREAKQAQLKAQLRWHINQIETNPNSLSTYDKFIKFWKSSTRITVTSEYFTRAKVIDEFFNKDYYDRILKICKDNSSNVQAWQLLAEVLQCLEYFQNIKIWKIFYRSNTFDLLTDNLLKEFNNQPIKERILVLISLLRINKQAETQALYDTSLKILEANSTSQEAKKLVLDFGRLHYSILRPNKKPTIYDEQAIQNDVIVRANSSTKQ
jgi:hypothetical protein